MASCLKMPLRLWMRLFNYALGLLGFILIAFGTYLLAGSSRSSFSVFVFVFGVFVLIAGTLGVMSVGSRHRIVYTLYVILLAVLTLFELLCVIGFFGFPNMMQTWLVGTDEQADKFFRSNRELFRGVLIVSWILEMVSVMFLLMCGGNVALTTSERLDLETEFFEPMDTALLAKGTPQTDARRAELNAKYGGIFGKSRTSNNSNNNNASSANSIRPEDEANL